MLRDLIQKAEQGSTDAQYELGRLYRSEQFYKYAFHWFLKAAKQGHSKAQNAVVEMLLLCRKKTSGQGHAASQNTVDKMLHSLKETQRTDETTFYQIIETAEQEKIDLEAEFDNRLGHIRKEWGVEELEAMLGLAGKDDSCCPYDDPYYSPRYNPNIFDFEIPSSNEQKYLEDLKKRIKEDFQSPGIILATKETTCSLEYSGKCQVLILANKNIYKIPPYSQNADEYFKRFYNEIRQENANRCDCVYRKKQGRLRTLFECRRYEDYFVVEILGAYECTDVSFENKAIRQIVKDFKRKYMK